MRQAVVLAFSAMVLSACSEPLEFADWTIPVPEGTPVFEYAMVSMDERAGNVIAPQPDLVLGGDPSDPNTAFYRSGGVAIDTRGRIYVVDTGNYRVQVFDADGTFVRSLGGEGQGPGEFGGPRNIAIVGGRVMVYDGKKRRFVTWDLEGAIAGEVAMEGAAPVLDTMAMADGSLVLLYSEIHGQRLGQAQIPQDIVLRGFDVTGRPGITYLRLASMWPMSGLGFALEPAYAVDPAGTVYVSTSEEYQIHALSTSGAPKWALRVNYPRRSVNERLESVREVLRQVRPDSPPADIERRLQEYNPRELEDSLVAMRVDGHGHLYVVLNISWDERRSLQLHPDKLPFAVDVYSREGEHVYSGVLDGPLWDAAAVDYVYYDATDAETQERVVVRAVIREPFN